MEVWKDIAGYEGLYQISNFGNVKSFYMWNINKYIKRKQPKILKLTENEHGYYRVSLIKNKKRKHKRVHRLVAEAFIPNIENKPQVNHIDGNKQNNCVDNLEWATRDENMKHAWRTGLINTTKKIFQYDINNNLIKEWKSLSEAGRKIGICPQSICECAKGKIKTSGGFIWRYENISEED